MRRLRIVIVEDDHLQAQWLRELIQTIDSCKAAEIEVLNTERAFRERFAAFRAKPPDLFVFDVMLPWDRPSPNQAPPPHEVEEQGYSRAGVRCERLLRETKETAKVPVLLLTVLDKNDLRAFLVSHNPMTHHVDKAATDAEVCTAIGRLLQLS